MRYKCVCSYQGINYIGWQSQKQGNSIQEEIEKVLSIIFREEIEIVASGRTDAKVHAYGQVFHFDGTFKNCYQLQYSMNCLLPKIIRIIALESTDNQFHARFDAIAKEYIYEVCQDIQNPFQVDLSYCTNKIYNKKLMQKGCQLLEGTHDFTSFTSSKIDPRKSKIKTIYLFTLKPSTNGFTFIIIGNGFLRYMVRMIVASILALGCGKITLEQLKMMLQDPNKHACNLKAQAQGLYLNFVYYSKYELKQKLAKYNRRYYD